jgi:hypothetical protein
MSVVARVNVLGYTVTATQLTWAIWESAKGMTISLSIAESVVICSSGASRYSSTRKADHAP